MTVTTKSKTSTESSKVTILDVQGGTLARVETDSGQWEFTRWQACQDGQPRIRDLDAAEKLEFKDPKSIRVLIRRTWPGKKIKNIHVVIKVMPTAGAVKGGLRKEREYWLTEAQLLKVIARCRTEVAEGILDEMISVYMLARQGLLPQQHAGQEIVTELRKALESYRQDSLLLRRELEALRSENAQIKQLLSSNTSPHGLLGADKAHEICGRIQRLADLEVVKSTSKSEWNSRRRKYEISVSKAAGWPQNGKLCEQLVNADQEGRAWIRLREIEKEIRDRGEVRRERKEPQTQTALPIDLSFKKVSLKRVK